MPHAKPLPPRTLKMTYVFLFTLLAMTVYILYLSNLLGEMRNERDVYQQKLIQEVDKSERWMQVAEHRRKTIASLQGSIKDRYEDEKEAIANRIRRATTADVAADLSSLFPAAGDNPGAEGGTARPVSPPSAAKAPGSGDD